MDDFLKPRGGWFDYLFDSEHRQRTDINRSAKDLSLVQLTQEQQNDEMARLRQELGTRKHEVVELRATVVALAGLLVERGVLDRAQVEQRVREAHAEMVRPPPAAPAAGDQEAWVSCAACGKKLARSRTNVTADGELCDACFAKR